MRSMRILITNNTLDFRGGSELYVRDLAIALLKRGHLPIAYSTKLGEIAQEIRAATVPVIDNLDALAAPPDVIHGHHHLDTMTALLRFPRVPAVYFCHGWLPWKRHRRNSREYCATSRWIIYVVTGCSLSTEYPRIASVCSLTSSISNDLNLGVRFRQALSAR